VANLGQIKSLFQFDLATDSDKDGLPDWWEKAHGLNHKNRNDALATSAGGRMTNLAAYRNHLDPADASAPVASSLAPSDPPVVITLRSSRLNNSTTDNSSAFIDIDPGSPPLIKNGDFEEGAENRLPSGSSDFRKWYVGEGPSPITSGGWKAIGGDQAVSSTDPNAPGSRANHLQWEVQQQLNDYTLPSRYSTRSGMLNQYVELDAHWERVADGNPIQNNFGSNPTKDGKSDRNKESDHGIKQTVSLSRGNYLLLFDYRGRVGSDSNQFKVSAKGDRAVDVETDLIAEKDASDPITGQSPTGLQKWKQGSVSFSVSGGNPADTAALPVILKFDLVLAPGKKPDSFGVFIDNVILLPLEMRITDRDDPKKKWADNVVKTAPVYSGKSTGDMVSWKLGGTDSWTNATFSWSAEGPETKTGPSGTGKNEWKIADGDEDTAKDWLDWKPGKYKIKCTISFAGGSNSTAEFEQEVGVRTDDVVVVGWIDPAQVPLNSSGVQSALVRVFPPGGLTSGDSDEAKAKAAQLLNIIATQGVNFTFAIGDSSTAFTPFSATDKTYALNWMFKYAGNLAPPSAFTDSDGFFSQQTLDDFATETNHTRYKLINHYQAKYRIGDDQKFKPGTLVHLKHYVNIGYTKDPSRYYEVGGIIAWIGKWVNSYPADGAFPGTAGPNNSRNPVTKETESKLCNEGRPDQKALDAFMQLTGKDQGQIWSSITFFSDPQHYSETTSSTTGQSLTRAPKPQYFYQGRINTQLYPTYWMYINGKKEAAVQSQAPSPSALFSNTDKCQ